MTSAVEILTPILSKTLTSVEDWKSLMEYAQRQIKPTPVPMTEHEILVQKYEKECVKFFRRKVRENKKKSQN